jgi:DnaJ-class molecular chaperone
MPVKSIKEDGPCPSCRGDYWFWLSCPKCNGTGICKGMREIRTWVPDTLKETEEVVGELEEVANAGSSNPWVIVNALRRGYSYSNASGRATCFPQTIIDKIKALEMRLPPPCHDCKGQGTVLTDASRKCSACKGRGIIA